MTTLLARQPKVEAAISWAFGQGYCFAEDAAIEYARRHRLQAVKLAEYRGIEYRETHWESARGQGYLVPEVHSHRSVTPPWHKPTQWVSYDPGSVIQLDHWGFPSK